MTSVNWLGAEEMDLTKSLIVLLGKPKDSAEAATFLADWIDAAEVFDGEGYTFYEFHSHGFNLTYSKSSNFFSDVFFHLRTPSVSDGTVSAYAESLPYDITSNDSRHDVEIKMNSKPSYSISPQDTPHMSSKVRWEDSYSIFPLRLIFDFQSNSGPVNSVFVAYTT